MGLETILLLSVTAASAVGQRVAARKAARASRTANNIQTATGQRENLLARRKAAREERIRRARLLQSSENQGVAGSSGSLGALSSLSTNAGAAIAAQSGNAVAAAGISAALQRKADAQYSADKYRQLGQLATKGIGMASDAGAFE
jgi:hypothetical protein